LYSYEFPSLELNKGARATRPLWNQPVAFRHLYTFEPRVRRDPRTGRREETPEGNRPPNVSDGSPLRLTPNQVWHQLELENKGNQPWTTGPALVMGKPSPRNAGDKAVGIGERRLPISQELLTYTSPGGKTLLPLTVAVDMRGTIEEEELSRTEVRIAGNDYVEVNTRYTITIVNQRKEASSTRIRAAVGGEAREATDGGTIRLSSFDASDWTDASWIYRVNSHSDVSWELNLEPGQSKTVTVVAKYFLR
jgi:hypothetical protein